MLPQSRLGHSEYLSAITEDSPDRYDAAVSFNDQTTAAWVRKRDAKTEYCVGVFPPPSSL